MAYTSDILIHHHIKTKSLLGTCYIFKFPTDTTFVVHRQSQFVARPKTIYKLVVHHGNSLQFIGGRFKSTLNKPHGVMFQKTIILNFSFKKITLEVLSNHIRLGNCDKFEVDKVVSCFKGKKTFQTDIKEEPTTSRMDLGYPSY